MIASTSAIKLLLLATIVFAKNDDQQDGSSTLLRGKIKQVPYSSRTLIEMPNLNLDQMVCTEYASLNGLVDGSVVCSFRTIPPSDMTSGKIHHDCLLSTAMGHSYCISTEVYLANFNDVPGASGTIGAQGSVPVTGAQGSAPATGNALGTPTGLTQVPTPAPTPALVQIVDADVNVIVGTGPPPVGSAGVILPQFTNPTDCPPTVPGDDVSCPWNRRCQYYERDATGTPISALNCDCNGDMVFQCRTAQDPYFQQFSF